jgi:hypothetical protein
MCTGGILLLREAAARGVSHAVGPGGDRTAGRVPSGRQPLPHGRLAAGPDDIIMIYNIDHIDASTSFCPEGCQAVIWGVRR